MLQRVLAISNPDIYSGYNNDPPLWCLHLIVVRGFEYVSDPENYTSGSVATGRASFAGQVKGRRQTKSVTKTDARSSVISNDLKHSANDARNGLSLFSNRRDQSGLNGCCTAMWKANGKTTTLSLFLASLFPKTEIPYICEMLPLDIKQSGGKLLPQSDLRRGGSVSIGNVMQALQQEGVQRADGTSQLQDWNMEGKDLEARRQIRELENGNAEE